MGQPIRIEAPTQGQVLQPDLPPSKRYFEKWSNLTAEQQNKSGSKREHSKKRIEEGLKLPRQEARDKSKTVIKKAETGSENQNGESYSSDMFVNVKDEPFQGPYNQEATRSGKGYFNEFDPGKRIGKSEMKGAVDAGVSYHKINKYIQKTGAETTQGGSNFLKRKLADVSKKLKHYDPTTAGGGGFTKKDVKYLMSEEGGGHSAKKVEKLRDKYVDEGQIRVGDNTQKHIDRIGGKDTKQPIESPPVNETPVKDAPNPVDETPRQPKKKGKKMTTAMQIATDLGVSSQLGYQLPFGDSALFQGPL